MAYLFHGQELRRGTRSHRLLVPLRLRFGLIKTMNGRQTNGRSHPGILLWRKLLQLCSSTRDTFEQVHTPIHVPCSLMYSSSAVEDTVVTGKFRRVPDPSCSFFTVASIHINNWCAMRRSVCVALLLPVCDLCLQLGAVVLTSDFNKGCRARTSPWWLQQSASHFSAQSSLQLRQCSVAHIRASHRCGVPAVSFMVTGGLSVA